eukprot:7188-Heterococcus_DN1.PRE.2
MPGLRHKWRAYNDAQDCKHAVEHERVYLAKQARPRLMTHHRVAESKVFFETRGMNLLSTKVIETALAIIFSEQGQDGLWNQGQAIYNGASPRRTPTDDVERRRDSTGRDVGNSYAFSFDLLGCLLDTFAEFPLLERYGSNLERSLQWTEDNILLQYYDEACDVEAMTVVGKPLRGWRSSHLQQEVTQTI